MLAGVEHQATARSDLIHRHGRELHHDACLDKPVQQLRVCTRQIGADRQVKSAQGIDQGGIGGFRRREIDKDLVTSTSATRHCFVERREQRGRSQSVIWVKLANRARHGDRRPVDVGESPRRFEVEGRQNGIGVGQKGRLVMHKSGVFRQQDGE